MQMEMPWDSEAGDDSLASAALIGKEYTCHTLAFAPGSKCCAFPSASAAEKLFTGVASGQCFNLQMVKSKTPHRLLEAGECDNLPSVSVPCKVTC